jgi:sulfhydrogenase subunit alpha
MKKLEIDVHHITRVEGHGNLKVRASDGHIEELQLEIVESPRFFESMLMGRFADEAPSITSRICGICAVGHASAACRAAEKALGFAPPPEVSALRKVLLDLEFLQSHVLHLYFLVAPDLFGQGSVIPLAESHPDVVLRALRLKKLANRASEILVGRKVHPVAMAVGGFTRWPAKAELAQVQQMLEGGRADVEATLDLFAALPSPDLIQPAEAVALRGETGYALLEGRLTSSAGVAYDEEHYPRLIHEYTVAHSSARHVRTDRGPLRVGALARATINRDRLLPAAAKAAARLGLPLQSQNPFHNNTAQVVECVQCLEEAITLLDGLLDLHSPPVYVRPAPAAGVGIAAVEVPRGTLYHHYETDAAGRIVKANCIIPTGQNQAAIEQDLRTYVGTLVTAGRVQDEIRAQCEMLVRAYDPCISCAAHFLEVELV